MIKMFLLLNRSIATMFAAFLVLVAFPNAWGQTAGTDAGKMAHYMLRWRMRGAPPAPGPKPSAPPLRDKLVYEQSPTVILFGR